MDKHELIEFIKSLELKGLSNEPKDSFDYEELSNKGIVEAFTDLDDKGKHYVASLLKLYPAIYYNLLARKVYKKDISRKIDNYFGDIKRINNEYHRYFFHQYVGPFFYINGEFKYLKMDVSDGDFEEEFINHPSSHFDFFNSFNLDEEIDYGYYPRGRVIFNNLTNEFYIYVDNELFTKKELIEAIKKIYNLTGYNNIVMKDDHYTNSGLIGDNMSNLDKFVELINTSLVESKYKPNRVGKNRFYFGDDYFNALKPLYEGRVQCKESIKEFNYVPRHRDDNVKKICSVSSSARLCFSWLYKKGAWFEANLTNGTNQGNNAQLDAYIEKDNTYYECKCQEVINGEGQKLKRAYKSILEDEFDVKNIKINEDEKTLSFNLKDMGCAKLDAGYDRTHFNLKQLFTHLASMSKLPKDKPVALKYIIFRPSKEKLAENIEIQKIYETLNREMEEIYRSRSIQYFLNKHKNIKLEMDPEDVYVDVDDPEMMVGIEK